MRRKSLKELQSSSVQLILVRYKVIMINIIITITMLPRTFLSLPKTKYPAEFHNTDPILFIEGDDHIFSGAFMAGAAAEGGKSTVAVHTSL